MGQGVDGCREEMGQEPVKQGYKQKLIISDLKRLESSLNNNSNSTTGYVN